MKNKKLLLIPAIIIPILVAGIFFINTDTSANTANTPNLEENLTTDEITSIPSTNDVNIKNEVAYEIPPIPTEKTETTPQTEVVTDEKGNQVITPNVIVPNPNGVTPKPGTETKAETPKVENKPIETPAPTEKPKTETPKVENKPSTNKPTSNTAKDGDRRVVNGKEEVFDDAFGWLPVTGGESEVADFELSGNIIGH